MIYKNVETVGGKSNTKPVAIIGNKKKTTCIRVASLKIPFT